MSHLRKHEHSGLEFWQPSQHATELGNSEAGREAGAGGAEPPHQTPQQPQHRVPAHHPGDRERGQPQQQCHLHRESPLHQGCRSIAMIY